MLLSFSPWTAVSPSIEGFLSAPSRVLSPLDRSSCLLHQSYAENHLNAKIKALCNDKGGEYMSSAFLHFTTDAGISRQHTVQNRPQQNGVAERANRTMAEGVTVDSQAKPILQHSVVNPL